MDILAKLCHPYWKQYDEAGKRILLSQALRYFVNPNLEISDIRLAYFEQGGVKTETFSLRIDGRAFVFVPGQEAVVLGWDNGLTGVDILDVDADRKELSIMSSQFCQSKHENGQMTRLTQYPDTVDDAWVNQHMSPVRQAVIPPMFVAVSPEIFGLTAIGHYDIETGVLEVAQAVDTLEADIQNYLATHCDIASWSVTYPTSIWLPNGYQLTLVDDVTYAVYQRETVDSSAIAERFAQDNMDILTEDEWEYCCGGSTRRIFRWGNHLYRSLYCEDSDRQVTNMFGLEIATGNHGPELTTSGFKGDWLLPEAGAHLANLFALSSYFRHDTHEQQQHVTPFCARPVIRLVW